MDSIGKTVPDKIHDVLVQHAFCASEFTDVDVVTFECGIGVNMACKESWLDAINEHLMWALFELFKQETESVWVAEWGGYIHGVFATEKDAAAYENRRWNGAAPLGWRITEREVSKGAFDPLDDEEENES